jgi:hypothetical protein
VFGHRSPPSVPLPDSFLAWQVELRRRTMIDSQGAPRAGVAPLVTVRRPGAGLDVSTHSIICGLLPHPRTLAAKTDEFRQLYERWAPDGAKAIYDAGIEYLRHYYQDTGDFDPESVTTLVDGESDLALALGAEPRCTLLFYVFDLVDRTPVGRFRCLELDCTAELHRDGPVFDNVWWHNTLFHGKQDRAVVVRFRHHATHDTAFGKYERVV